MYEETHENLERLRRLFSGEASLAEADRAAAHLTSCRECWLLAARAVALQKASGKFVAQGPLKPVVDLQEMQQRSMEERLEAQATWAEIRSLGIKGRRDKVRLTRSLHTRGFLEVLLEEGVESVVPAESEELFYLALLVAGQFPSSQVSNDLCAECCAEIANARRRLAKWPATRDALRKHFLRAGRSLS